jgi:pyrimidine-specific ribonucleoside hydrolase
MDVILNSPIPLVFAGYEPSSYTHIGNIDLASLDEEADKWLFDVVQPGWKNEKYFGVRGFIPLTVRRLA